ncbi:MAG TPA: NfeD family protein [Oceanipulchritudo sp.]|nr:NfeD family protein [Oceanipulchritudo sp.]
MSLMLGLIIIAFALFFFEIFMPGGILAVIGAILLLIASFLAYDELGFSWALAIFFAGPLGALAMFFVEIKFISKTRFGNQLSLKSTIAAQLNPKADENLVGQEGVTLTILAPSGKVRVGGTTYTASAEDGLIDKDVPVRVIRTETFKLIVERI